MGVLVGAWREAVGLTNMDSNITEIEESYQYKLN